MNDSLIITIAAIALLLVASAFFSGSETALTGASRPRMHLLERSGDRRPRIVNTLLLRQERVIGGLLIGNNIVNILAPTLATGPMIAPFGVTCVASAPLRITVLFVVSSEVVPQPLPLPRAPRWSP